MIDYNNKLISLIEEQNEIIAEQNKILLQVTLTFIDFMKCAYPQINSWYDTKGTKVIDQIYDRVIQRNAGKR